MKAIVQDTYGSADVLELRDIDPPVPAGPRTPAARWYGAVTRTGVASPHSGRRVPPHNPYRPENGGSAIWVP